MSVEAQRLLSVEEYLLQERESAERHEYWDGRAVAMAGASRALSPSTVVKDRGLKLFAYRGIGSLRVRPLVAQDRTWIGPARVDSPWKWNRC